MHLKKSCVHLNFEEQCSFPSILLSKAKFLLSDWACAADITQKGFFFFSNVCLPEGYLLTATQSKPTKGLCEHPCADVVSPHVPWLWSPFHFHRGRLRNTFISSLFFHSVKQSQTPPGTYSSRYFYRTHVLAHTLVLRQPHLTLKMTFKQWTELCSILSKVMPWRSHRMDTGELEMLHCHPDCCLQNYAVVFAEWKKICQSSSSSLWPAVQGRLRHTCPAKDNKMLTCTEVMGVNHFPDLPAPLESLSSHTIRFYLGVFQGGMFFCVVEGFEFLSEWVGVAG